jgi:hypothetical protein
LEHLLDDKSTEWRTSFNILFYFKKFVIVKSDTIEDRHLNNLIALIRVIRKALVVDLRVRHDLKTILIREKENTFDSSQLKELIETTSRLNFFWNWKKSEGNDESDADEHCKETSVEKSGIKSSPKPEYDKFSVEIQELSDNKNNTSKFLTLSTHIHAATLALLVPLGIAGCPPNRESGITPFCKGTPSLVCMPRVNHRQPDFEKVGNIMESIQGGVLRLDENFRLLMMGRDPPPIQWSPTTELPEQEHWTIDKKTWMSDGRKILESCNGLPLFANDIMTGDVCEWFAQASLSENKLSEKITEFANLILGEDAMNKGLSTAKKTSMASYMYTLLNFFKPFGADVTQVATWQNLYNHLCDKSGLKTSELTGPYCLARLFQRCRLLIQSTSPPVPVLLDGLTRTTAMVYFLSGVYRQTEINLGANEFARHQYNKHSNRAIAEPLWMNMKKVNGGNYDNMSRLAQKSPITLLTFDRNDFEDSLYDDAKKNESIEKICKISRQYQDQVTKASARSLKEETIRALEGLDLTVPVIPVDVSVRDEHPWFSPSFRSAELYGRFLQDYTLGLPVSQNFPRIALAAKALLAGGSDNPIQALLGTSENLIEGTAPRLCHMEALVAMLSVEPADYVEIGKQVLRAIQGLTFSRPVICKGQFYPHHYFVGGNCGTTAFAASLLSIVCFVYSLESRNRLVSLLKSNGRGSVIQVQNPDDDGLVSVRLPDNSFELSNQNVTTAVEMVRWLFSSD